MARYSGMNTKPKIYQRGNYRIGISAQQDMDKHGLTMSYILEQINDIYKYGDRDTDNETLPFRIVRGYSKDIIVRIKDDYAFFFKLQDSETRHMARKRKTLVNIVPMRKIKHPKWERSLNRYKQG